MMKIGNGTLDIDLEATDSVDIRLRVPGMDGGQFPPSAEPTTQTFWFEVQQ